MDRDDLNVLSAFMAVAEERSFTKAARRVGVSQSALSHAIRGLEEEIGVRLLARTTRSVAPTEAGEELLRSLRPALSDVRAALGKLAGMRGRPAGRVRLIVSPLAASSVLGPKLGQFARTYHDVVLDVTTEESRVDLVAGGYDAGIHYGEFIEQDMVAIRVSPDHRPAIVGAPGYFESHPTPKSPRDLLKHRCINFRHSPEQVYRWEFENSKQSVSVAVNGPLVVDDVDLVIRAALDGVGLAYLGEDLASSHLKRGALVRVLEPWCQPFPGFFLYYPSRRHHSAALAALIDTLRLKDRPK
jgi:DNA-binding transcriptional LysR family regulator